MDDRPEWLAPKRYGIGAGLPISWQGWAVTGAYIAIIGLAAWLLRPEPIAILSVVVPATALLIAITARTTRGGWRWRWGEKQ